ncbi:dnaK protein [Trichomonas vaginalis G3]|uniref:DnaK protein n=4 Tax=Trichomonas vaginalis (strain ATCC PRA-98 / G3) TaxID=412133 RepID=A2G8T1_TRIV3|nr:dnaK protein [Trichomonas vaginalis G3]|eukprot:XP_001299364.1 dnaK protein [Trichomonas vaginalis G3]
MKHIVGIDLGFSNTICSYSDNGSVKQLVFETSAILPSYIYEIYNFSNNTLNPKLKNNIREFSANYDKHLIFGSKKLLGRDFNHPNVKNFVYSHKNQMDIVNKNGKPTYKLIFQNGDISKEIYLSPDDVSAQILSYVSETYRSKFGHAIDSCVVTVPAKFDSNQRRDTISAIEKSGIKCLKLINEPTAAAFSYFSEHQTNNQKILIFDYGAGTLDVSIVEIKGKEFEVLYTEGNSDLGGHDLDLILYEDVLNTFKSKNKDITTIPDRSARILMLEVEQAKIKLSAESKATITIEDFASGYDLKVNIFRNHYEELISDEIEKSRKVLFNAIRGSKVEAETISAVFPIGGTCRTPLVQKMLNEFFNNTPKYDKYYLDFKGKVKIVNELSYEYSVSIGACKLAKILDSGDKIIDRIHYDKLANNVVFQMVFNDISSLEYVYRVMSIYDLIYPIGAVYTSMNPINPNTLFGGRWYEIVDSFPFYTNTQSMKMGGSKKIGIENLPSHMHRFSGRTSVEGNHSHSITKRGYINLAAGSNRQGMNRYDISDDPKDVSTGIFCGTAGNHTHVVAGITDPAGNGKDYMPPYITMHAWIRVG